MNAAFDESKDPAMLYLRISVVMMRHDDSGLIWTSPVRRPTSPKVFLKSLNFWLDSALMGEV